MKEFLHYKWPVVACYDLQAKGSHRMRLTAGTCAVDVDFYNLVTDCRTVLNIWKQM